MDRTKDNNDVKGKGKRLIILLAVLQMDKCQQELTLCKCQDHQVNQECKDHVDNKDRKGRLSCLHSMLLFLDPLTPTSFGWDLCLSE